MGDEGDWRGTGGVPSDWAVGERPPDPDWLRGEHKLVRRVLWGRGLRREGAARDWLAARGPEPAPWPALDASAARVLRAADAGETVAIYGDYDADGLCATAVLLLALEVAGARAIWHIPQRVQGHGLRAADLGRLRAAGASLAVSCDCGAGDGEAILAAAALGLEVVVTDHHPQDGPSPRAVVANSADLPPGHPYARLGGAGVAWLLARAVLRGRGRGADATGLLDLVALGLVADVAPQTETARAMLALGLPRLWGRPRPGVAALLARAGRAGRGTDTAPISFTLGPALNAAGRMGDSTLGLRLLLARDPAGAVAIAKAVWDLNLERRAGMAALEGEVWRAAELAGPGPGALVLAGEGWPPAILGPLAGQVAERTGRAAVLLSLSERGMQGSGRAPAGVDLLGAIRAQAALLESYGGHAQAAGLRGLRADLGAFREGFARAIGTQSRPPGRVAVDALVPWDRIAGRGAELCRALAPLAPHTADFPPAVLGSAGVTIRGRRRLGKDGARLELEAGGAREHAVWWRAGEAKAGPAPRAVAVTAAMDLWEGRERPQLTVTDLR